MTYQTATAAAGPGQPRPRPPTAALPSGVRVHQVSRLRRDGPAVLDRIDLDVGAGRVRLPARRVRVRQVDPAVNLMAGLDAPDLGQHRGARRAARR